MKKEYKTPKAERMDFDYKESVTASGSGWTLREYVNGYTGCRETPTDNWFVDFVRENGCRQL